MCEQCSAKTYSFGEVLPGWSLVRATRDGLWMKADDWGLVRMNDPDFVWSTVLVPAPHEANDAHLDVLMKDPTVKAQDDDFMAAYLNFDEAMRKGCYPTTGWELVHACRESGYDKERSGANVLMWLADHIGRFLDGKDFAKVRQECEEADHEQYVAFTQRYDAFTQDSGSE